MIKKAQYSYKGMNQDLSKSKRGPDLYFEAKNIRITPVEDSSLGSVTIEKGNDLVLTLNIGYDVSIIEAVDIDKYLVLFTTDDSGNDAIYRVDMENDYSWFRLIKGDLGFSTESYIEAFGNYENDSLIKVYWVDGINQYRYINIINPVTDIGLLDVVPEFSISQPKLVSTSRGGIHETGKIQYAYNLSILYGQQTSVSPISPLYNLTKQKGGGTVNEIVSQINHIKIDNIDTRFDIIKIYAIKYTSYNESPTISLLAEEEINGNDTLTYSDDGNVIYNISLEELLFLGGTPIVPGTIEVEKNRVVLGDITETYFKLNTDLSLGDDNYFDTRAYRFPENTTTTKIKNYQQDYKTIKKSSDVFLLDDDSLVEETHDCINEELDLEVISTSAATSPTITESCSLDTDYVYEFTIPTYVPTGDNFYIKIQILTTVESYLNKDIYFEVDSDNSSNINQIIVNKLNSSSFTSGNYKIVSYVEDNKVKFYVYSLEYGEREDIETRYSVNTTNSLVSIYDEVSTSTGDISYLYQYKSSIYGASGTDIDIAIVSVDPDSKDNVLKDNEVYRFAMEFYNTRGQYSPASWICDLKAPQRNLVDGTANGLKVTINNPDKLKAQGIVGYRLLRVERTDANKTRLDQGILSSSVLQILTETEIKDCQEDGAYNTSINITNKLDESQLTIVDSLPKMPNPLFRTYNDIDDYNVDKYGITGSGMDANLSNQRTITINGIKNNHLINSNDLRLVNDDSFSGKDVHGRTLQPYSEFFSTRKPNSVGKGNKQIVAQNTNLYQMYSPEAIILQRELTGVDAYMPLASLSHSISDCNVWGKKYEVDTQLVEKELTKTSSVSLYDVDSSYGDEITDEGGVFGDQGFYAPLLFHQNGLIGPTGDNLTYVEYQYGRSFSFNAYLDPSYQNKLPILGDSPLFVGRGEKNKIFNNPNKYKFNNHFGSLLCEKNLKDQRNSDSDEHCQVLSSVNSIGNNCYIFVDGSERELEYLMYKRGFTAGSSDTQALLTEFTRVLVNQYGGNTYEARSRNAYIRIGNYTPISTTEITIENPGDIFVNVFRFARVLPNISKVYSSKFTSICEIVEFPVESSIDLNNRSDYSIDGWNSIFHPSYDDYHAYNRVYSQEPIFTTNNPESYTSEPIKHFSTKINATKGKTSGELIDSWTDILLNEELILNGSYGKLVKLINNNGRMLAFQETAIATVQVEPRIQQVTTDGVGVELGTGQVLYNYEYNISTTSGSTNKRAIFKSPNAVYYIDSINKSINRISQGLEGLTDMHGLHSFAEKNIIDSYRNSIDVHGAFDYINNDAYFIFEDDFAIRFNEMTNSFTDLINLEECNIIFKSKFGLHSSNNSNKIYKHFEGNRATYYGTTYDSSITLLANPNPYSEVVFNNINFKSELYDVSDEDVFTTDGISHTVPLESIKIWNEYQESNVTPLIYNTNITRAFRDWSMILPRDASNPLDRIRGQWCYIKLNINNDNNYNLILHDVILSYYDNTNIR